MRRRRMRAYCAAFLDTWISGAMRHGVREGARHGSIAPYDPTTPWPLSRNHGTLAINQKEDRMTRLVRSASLLLAAVTLATLLVSPRANAQAPAPQAPAPPTGSIAGCSPLGIDERRHDVEATTRVRLSRAPRAVKTGATGAQIRPPTVGAPQRRSRIAECVQR